MQSLMGIKDDPDPEIESLKKQLRDSVLWIRWNAVLQRQNDIKEIQRMRDLYKASTQKNENSNLDDDEADFENARKIHVSFDVLDAVPLLEKLGYLDTQSLHDQRLSDEEYKDIVAKALNAAADEKGNELPKDFSDEVGMATPQGAAEISAKIRKAQSNFFESVSKIFKRSFRKVFLSPRNRSKITSGELAGEHGHSLFSDPEDVANKFAMMMLEKLTSREFSQKKGEPKSWDKIGGYPNFGKEGKKEFDKERDELIGKLVAYFRTYLTHIASKEEQDKRATHAPSLGLTDTILNRAHKANRINDDIRKNDFGFYTKYLRDLTLGKAESVSWWSEKSPEAKARKSEQTSGLSKEDKLRIEIISHIVSLNSRYSQELSLNPLRIEQTLKFYRENFLIQSQRKPSFLGAMGSRNNDSGDELYDPTADDGISKTPNVSASQQVANQASSSELIKDLHSVMRSLSALNPNWALAVCVKWGLNCTPSGNVNSSDNFLNALVQFGKDKKKVKGGNSLECLKQLQAISAPGVENVEEVAKKISNVLAQPELQTPENFRPWVEKVRGWINKGLQFVCNNLPKEMEKRNVSLRPSMRFDSSKISPLSSIMNRRG
jgi:hypothetical protein